MLKFFPVADEGMQAALMEELVHICHDAARLAWLVKRAVQVYGEWPGVMELRALYCEFWTPADGAKAWSDIFPMRPGGAFPEHPLTDVPGARKALPAAEMRLLEPGEPVSQDPESVKLVDALAEKLRMPRGLHVRDATHKKLLDMGFLEPEGWR